MLAAISKKDVLVPLAGKFYDECLDTVHGSESLLVTRLEELAEASQFEGALNEA